MDVKLRRVGDRPMEILLPMGQIVETYYGPMQVCTSAMWVPLHGNAELYSQGQIKAMADHIAIQNMPRVETGIERYWREKAEGIR